MEILVLGAGLVGITTAWYCRALGHTVTVVDRHAAVAQETSFANGGQLSFSHVEPWANPSVLRSIPGWLWRGDGPLRFRPQADFAQWRWAVQFLANCTHFAVADNARNIASIARASREALDDLDAELALEYRRSRRGILTVYSDPAAYRDAVAGLAALRHSGAHRRALAAEEIETLEPALHARDRGIIGGLFAPDDGHGDARLFCEQLAQACVARGVNFAFDTAIDGVLVRDKQVDGVRVQQNGTLTTLKADAYVVALGSYTPLLLRPLGIESPVYPLKGYSVTVPVVDAARVPSISVTDTAYKLVISPLGEQLRVAGTAELAGYDTAIDTDRCATILRRVEALFPGAVDTSKARFWAGLRPATPSGVPTIERSRLTNLWINSGQGTLGWTLACGSGKLLAGMLGEAHTA
jgi:D-amino-acid dehydrogenase